MAYGWQRPRNPTKRKQILSACVWSSSSDWMMTNEGGLTGNAWHNFHSPNLGISREDVEKQGCAEVVVQSAIFRQGNTAQARLRSMPRVKADELHRKWHILMDRDDMPLPAWPCCAKLYKKGIIQPFPICTHVPAEAEKEGTVAKAEEFGSVGKVVS
uniref:Uncharacterized protein n=1 Tax=Oryza rufipogon TaxID=4529 RepID=A0A0E0NZD2_ORYRU